MGKQSIAVRALVDTGATFMCVTEEIAVQLGFDIVIDQLPAKVHTNSQILDEVGRKMIEEGRSIHAVCEHSERIVRSRSAKDGCFREVSTHMVTLTDGRQIKVPRIAPIEIVFSNRTYVTEALVLGNEPLMGVLPLEAMDLIVDPLRQQLVVNLAHPNFPVAFAK
ncbi:MAG: hypothetical protein K0Q74_1129 [Gammaproteobacteria bacterium]|nr:hypothetical protein [Gammaproteobacteria bacterium]